MEKFSVKKPFTVLVAVIMVIMLGLVSVQNMQTNLLPNVNTPYLMVVTVYPGASPERVESEVSDVMESALGTISGVKNVTATSAENYSLLLMEFEDDICGRYRHEQRDGQGVQQGGSDHRQPAKHLYDPLHH